VSEFDVAIVGAGPAGSWAAYRLASAGARVALIDGSHPREKPCGGGLSARALDVLRPVNAHLPESVAIETARFAARGQSAVVPLRPSGGTPALAIASRRELDDALLAVAQTAGAQHIARRATGFARTNRGWTIDTDTNRLSASWIVGADGANSFVRRRVYRAFDRGDLSIASGYFVHGVSGRHIDIEFTERPPGYLWSFPRPDHLAVGICGQADRTSSSELLDGTARWLKGRVDDRGARWTRYSWPIPSLAERALERERPAGDRWILVGDAAGLVDPITREGIFFALQSAAVAAASLMGRDAVAAYTLALQTTIHQELRKAARMKERFFGSLFSGLLVAALQRSERIRTIMAGLVSGQQTYRGLRRRLLLTGELRLALEYLRLSA
jgi:geranylgeranyl reductase family protein